jgi:hypothetical protein
VNGGPAPFSPDELVAAATAAGVEAPAADEWTWEPLHGAGPSSATAGIWRVKGPEGTEPESLVLKVLSGGGACDPHWEVSAALEHPYYWRREADFYASGLRASFAGGFRAARCHLVRARPDRSVALWLEDVDGLRGAFWPLERYEVCACQLGRTQAHWLVEAELPTEPWLSAGFLREYVERRAPDFADRPPTGRRVRPRLASAVPPSLVAESRRVWRERRSLLDALDRLPRTVCHLDVWPMNLFARGDEETVAVDWAFVGVGAIGEDPANLLPEVMLELFQDSFRHADRLRHSIGSGYLSGLRDGGWDGDERLVQFAFAAAAALKYGWIAPRLAATIGDESALAALEYVYALPAEEVVERRARVVVLLHDLATEARTLALDLSLVA